MPLSLKRPLVFFDLETTGTNVRLDRIVEIAAVKLQPDGRRETWKRRINPQRLIPPAAMAIHGIRNEDVATAPTFAEVAFDLLRFLSGCDFAGFGIIRFDIPLLSEEFRRSGYTFATGDARLIDAQRIYHMREPRTLTAALKFYCGQEHAGAHGAEADTLATMEALEGQFQRYPDLPCTVDELGRICQPQQEDAVEPSGRLKWQGDEVIIAFGQKQGATLRELAASEPNYLKWMLNKDFPPEVKAVIRDALEGKFPQRTAAAPSSEIQEELPLA